MSVALAEAMRERLAADAGGHLAAWAATHQQALPQALVGWRQPQRAEDWPYVALVPTRHVRDLRQRELAEASVALAVGVRLPTQERPAAEGIEAAEALLTACIDTLAALMAYDVSGCVLVLHTADTVDAQMRHPTYELEASLALFAPGR